MGLHLGHLSPLGQAQIFPPRRHLTLCVIICVARHVFIDLFMVIHYYRYQVHPIRDVASMRLFRPLKHPQVDKLTPQHRTQQPFNPITTAVFPQPRESIVPRDEACSDTRLPPHLLLPPVMASLLTAEGYVIPHDEAYASANRHHHPTPPSPERLIPPPVGPAVRMRRPSESVPQNQATAWFGLGMGAC